MAEDWFLDVQKYAADADRNVVQKIVNYLGIALRNRDSSLVSFSDPQEVDRVRTNYLQKKLGLADSDDKLNAGLDWVKNLMSGDRTKNRVTVYYLLAHYFGKLDLFGGASGTSAASLGAGAGAASAAIIGGAAAVASVTPLRSEAAPPAATPSGADEIPVYPTPSTSRTSTGSTLGQGGSPSRPAYVADTEDDDRGGGGWPKWLTWLLVALAVIALFFLLKSCMAEKSSVTPNAASTAPASTGEAGLGANTNAASGNAQVAAATDVPTGAGVVSGERDSKPMLTVYFDTGKADVSKDMASAAATLTAYLNAHPGSKLAVSGYNDPSGNAAVNAALSKKRAQAVAAALASAGVPEASVQLVKPADTTTTTVTPEQARRVEITVQQ